MKKKNILWDDTPSTNPLKVPMAMVTVSYTNSVPLSETWWSLFDGLTCDWLI